MYARLSAFIPHGILETFATELKYNHVRIDERKFIGFLVVMAIGVGAIVSVASLLFEIAHPAIGFIGGFFGTVFTTYLLLRLSSESKGKYVENILPDALQLIASNMKSGLTTERSLFVAGRQEFGVLQYELRNASKRISSGEKIDVALRGIGDGINSPVLSKTLWLISRGIKSGGQIADLLFQLADDLKEQQAIEEETRSNISIYILLIFFSAVFGAPILFGISSFIVQVLSKQLAETPVIDAKSMPAGANLGPIKAFASGQKGAITPAFIMTFSMAALFVTTIFSCLTIGVITTGKEINGVKYIIPLLLIAFISFFSIRFALTLFFGNLL
ncbi:MAG TPA: type II secretion system F family protein [archaeon]|nr:type II secretion system F family protein [archaeon]